MRAILGVTGGIAAYKAAEVARSLMERGLSVQVVMTAGAQEFVRPMTFAALTGQKVITDLFGSGSAEETLSSSVEHISVAQDNQILVVVPATDDAWSSEVAQTYPRRTEKPDSVGRPGHGRRTGEVRARAGQRFLVHAVPRVHRSSGARPRDEHQHVESSGHARKHRDPEEARTCDRGACRWPAGVRHVRSGASGGAR